MCNNKKAKSIFWTDSLCKTQQSETQNVSFGQTQAWSKFAYSATELLSGSFSPLMSHLTVAWVQCCWTLRCHFCALSTMSTFTDQCGSQV